MTTNTELFDEIRELVVSARRTVARGVDLVQVYTNFEIGRRIVLEEQRGEDRAAYGQEILKSLAARLMGEFGKGFSLTNLKFMRQFYLQNQYRIGQSVTDQFGEEGEDRSLAGTSPAFEKRAVEASASGQPPSPPFTLSWTHYVFLLGIQDPAERRFYEIEAAAQDWTVRELKRQFDSSLYERLALSRDKEGVRKLAQEGQKIAQPMTCL